LVLLVSGIKENFSTNLNQYVILVTGPNEYENNVNNNFYTNYIAKWCLEYTFEQIQKVSLEYPLITKITEKVKSQMLNCNLGKVIGCYVLSFSEEHNVYLQQDGFLDKELVRVADLDTKTNQSKMVLG
jgi:maltose phosphorylase